MLRGLDLVGRTYREVDAQTDIINFFGVIEYCEKP